MYGANGYTGKLILKECIALGLKPIIAGRNKVEIDKLALENGLDYRIFSLQDMNDIKKGLDGINVILNCAGPFIQTIEPILKSCLEKRVHYFDITGEIGVFEIAHSYHEQAVEKGIIICPGTGFDVVPTDCLALMLKEQFQSVPENLELAFHSNGGPSKGTALTSLNGTGKGTKVRRNGKIVTIPYSVLHKEIAFPHKTLHVNSIPWGDVFTSYISTNIPNITVYMVMHPKTIKALKRGRSLLLLRNIQPLKWFVQRQVKKSIPSEGGPSEQVRKNSISVIWGSIYDNKGNSLELFLQTPNGYDLTAIISAKILSNFDTISNQKGYFTPSQLFGSNFILEFPDCKIINH